MIDLHRNIWRFLVENFARRAYVAQVAAEFGLQEAPTSWVIAYVREIGIYPNDLTCIYDVMDTFIPEHLVDYREEILALRNQALDAKGHSYPITVKQVVVNEVFYARQ